MVISKNGHIHIQMTKCRIWKVEQVTEFRYMRSTITKDRRCSKEIQKRIAMAKETFNKKAELLRGKLSKDLNKQMVKVLVWSVALHASQTWTLRNDDIKRLKAFEMWMWLKTERSAGQNI